ncbi:MAG: hypothetical protein ACRENK_07730 [Gemmatimonadaceae bacterium]
MRVASPSVFFPAPRSVGATDAGTSAGVARRHPKGFALAAALLAIMLIGALVSGVLFATTEETRAGTTGIARDMALIAAESAIATTVANPDLTLPVIIGIGGTLSYRSVESGSPVTVYITRLDSAIYSIVADVVPDVAHSATRRRIRVLAAPRVAADGSITIQPIPLGAWSELF